MNTTIKEVILQLCRLECRRMLGTHSLSSMTFDATHYLAKTLCAQLSVMILEREVKEEYHKEEKIIISVPLTWWDHLKGHMPSWFIARFPIKYKGIPTYVTHVTRRIHMCPHSNEIPWKKHLNFLTYVQVREDHNETYSVT